LRKLQEKSYIQTNYELIVDKMEITSQKKTILAKAALVGLSFTTPLAPAATLLRVQQPPQDLETQLRDYVHTTKNTAELLGNLAVWGTISAYIIFKPEKTRLHDETKAKNREADQQ
jgi:hypothetical protein